MKLATGGNMLNFGYWKESSEPVQAQSNLCNIFGRLADLQTARQVLDIGSGLSAPAIQWKLQFNFLDITCLNINFDQLKQSDSIDDIFLLNGTGTALPFANESFDRVLALESAQHMKSFENFISESKRVLKKDGFLALTIPIMNKKVSPLVRLGILSMTWSSEHYTLDYIKSSLIKNGFEIIKIEKIGPMVYEPLANYYKENRDSLKKKILAKYPSYVEKILYKSLQKMKQVSENNVIDYILMKCK